MKAKLPINEKERLENLRSYGILDSEAEALFDDIAKLASIICKTPVSLITFIDENRQWFKSKIGTPITETPRDMAFCAHTILHDVPLVVTNPTEDVRFQDNPLVTEDPKIRFYAGAPLFSAEGYKLGTLCVLDTVSKELTTEQIGGLEALARQVVSQLEIRRSHLKVTEEKQKSKEQLSNLLTTLDDCAWSIPLDPKEKVTLSEGVSKVFQRTPDELNSLKKFIQMVYPEDIPSITSWFTQVRERKINDSFKFEYRISLQDGSVRWIESRAKIVEYKDETRIEGISVNIQEKKQSQILIKEQEEKLALSYKLAALGEMSASISHEIKNSLSVISNYSELLAVLSEGDSLTKEEVINISGKLNLTVDKINKIIKNLKIYVRDGNLDPYVPVQVDTIVLDVLDLCKPKVVSHGIELLMPTAKIESTINCRSTQIYQVLVNLINNSCDAIENLKEKWIQVEVADEKNDVVFKITDSGNGIDKAIRDKIFQTFFTTKEVGKGTGLGLSISSKIILDHGGTMVINGEHKNTQFIIKLPKSVSKE